MSDRRPKRRCVAAKAQRQQAPSAIHYVGYVEDDETPEMIMKKFEELERIQKAAEARRQQQQQQQQQGGAGTSQAAANPGGVAAPGQAGAGAGPSGQAPSADGGAETTSVPRPGDHALGAGEQQQGGAGGPQPSAKAQDGVQGQKHEHQGLDGNSGGPDADGGGGGGGAGGGGADAGDPPLDEEALLEVFRQTSIFNIRSAMSHNDAGGADAGLASRYHGALYGLSYGMEDALFAGDDGEAGSDVDEEELQAFWSDDEYEQGTSRNRDGAGGGRRRRTGGGGRADRSDGGAGAPREARQPRAAGAGMGAARHAAAQVVTQYNRDTNALIRRRVAGGGGGGDGLVQLRVPPPPLPLSWGRTVRPYQPPEPYRPPDPYGPEAASNPATVAADGKDPAAAAAAASRAFEAADLPAFPFDSALGGKTYTAVMVNAGWQPEGAAEAHERGGEAEVMSRFRRLPIPRLVPRGFVLVWAHKGLIAAVCRQLAGWGYVYVENLTWVHLTPANAVAAQRGSHFRRSHSTLLMFRKEGEGRDIELRHQRNPDVVFDCIRTRADGCGWEMPGEVWTTVETLLPAGKGAFLELWAPRGARRPGWDHVSEVR